MIFCYMSTDILNRNQNMILNFWSEKAELHMLNEDVLSMPQIGYELFKNSLPQYP